MSLQLPVMETWHVLQTCKIKGIHESSVRALGDQLLINLKTVQKNLSEALGLLQVISQWLKIFVFIERD